MHTFPDAFPPRTISDIFAGYQLSPKYHPLHTNHAPITEQSIRCQIVTPKRKKPSNGTPPLSGMSECARDQPELRFMPGIQSQPVTIADLSHATAAYFGIGRRAFIPARRYGRRHVQEIPGQPAELAGAPGGRSDEAPQQPQQPQSEEAQVAMSSNEHPDMHGNPDDAPFLCCQCFSHCREEDLFESDFVEDFVFCSLECKEAWDAFNTGGAPDPDDITP